jgi:hypothetical protein
MLVQLFIDLGTLREEETEPPRVPLSCRLRSFRKLDNIVAQENAKRLNIGERRNDNQRLALSGSASGVRTCKTQRAKFLLSLALIVLTLNR